MLLALMLTAAVGTSDYRGIRPGMTLADVQGQCFSPTLGRAICRFDKGPSAVLYLTPKGRVWLIRVVLIGDDEAVKRSIAEYGLSAGPGRSLSRLAPDEVTFQALGDHVFCRLLVQSTERIIE